MKAFQRPQLVESIRSFFKVTGDYGAQLEEVIGLSMPLTSALDETPFLRFSVPVSGSNAASFSTVNRFAGVLFTPGPSVILDMRQVIIGNASAVAKVYVVVLMTAAQVALTTLVADSQMADLSSGSIGVISRPSTVRRSTHTAILGTVIATIVVPLGASMIWVPPGTIGTLYGTDPNGAPTLGVYNATLGQDSEWISGYGREWLNA